MVDWTGSGLPSLTDPLHSIAHAASGEDGSENESLWRFYNEAPPVPLFPEIRGGWPAACLPHAHLVALRMPPGPGPEQQVAALHERGHWLLANKPLVKLIRLLNFEMWIEMFNEEQKIVVPLEPNYIAPESPLQKTWAELALIYSKTALVQEIFAVWFSLYEAERQGLLTSTSRKQTEQSAKMAYSKTLPMFPKLYDSFKKVADQLGPTTIRLASYSLINNYEDLKPEQALTYAIERTSTELRRRGSVDEEFWSTLPVDAKFVPDYLDFTAARVQRRVTDETNVSLEYFLSYFKDVCQEPAGFLYQPDWQPLLSSYYQSLNDENSRLSLIENPLGDILGRHWYDVAEIAAERRYSGGPGRRYDLTGHRFLWFESIRQQLTQGIGLQCPLWVGFYDRSGQTLKQIIAEIEMDGSHSASGPTAPFRSFTCGYCDILERLWDRTVPSPKAREWKPKGCLCS